MSGPVKLTSARRETLALIESGKVRNIRCGYAAWRIFGANPTVVGQLTKLGLVESGPFDPDEIPYLLTPAGRAALEASK